MSGGEVSTRLSAYLLVCAGAAVDLYTYSDRSAILVVESAGLTVTISVNPTGIDPAALRFAQELADAVTRFAVDCQRFTTATGPSPAGGPSDRALRAG